MIKTVFNFTAATTNNKSCESLLDWNNNTTTIYTTPKCSKVGVRVKAMIDFVAIKDCFSLFQCRNNSSNNKTYHLDNSNNYSYRLILVDINMFPGSNTGDDNIHIDYNNEMTEANNNNEHTMIESYCNNNNDNNNDDNYDITYVCNNTEYCMSDTPFYLGLYRSASGVEI